MEIAMNAMNATFAAGATITELPPTARISLRLADPGREPEAGRGRIGDRSAEGAVREVTGCRRGEKDGGVHRHGVPFTTTPSAQAR